MNRKYMQRFPHAIYAHPITGDQQSGEDWLADQEDIHDQPGREPEEWPDSDFESFTLVEHYRFWVTDSYRTTIITEDNLDAHAEKYGYSADALRAGESLVVDDNTGEWVIGDENTSENRPGIGVYPLTESDYCDEYWSVR